MHHDFEGKRGGSCAVLAINAPFGNPPGNFNFFRSSTEIRFFKK